MQTRLIRLRFRRHWRKSQQQVEDLGEQAEQHLERHLFKRFDRLRPVRRFVLAWCGLLVLLIGVVWGQNLALSGYYQTFKPVPGGIYNEGVRGRFTNASPLFAATDADVTVSKLVFAGLFTYDRQGHFTGDLASGYSVDAHGTTYTVHLRPHLTWHDGQPLTSEDVLFTYQAIQNPDAQSPLQNSWKGITVSAPNPQTVVFKLPGILASFPYNLTNGIVPKHILGSVPAADLRSADFNTLQPVGAGPFRWQAVEVSGDGQPKHARQQVALTPFTDYHAGQPKLQKFVVQVFADQADMVQAFRDNRLTAIEGISEVPADLQKKTTVHEHSFLFRAATMVFFKNSQEVLADAKVRKALVQGANVPEIVRQLNYPTRQVREPLLQGQLAYDPTLIQPGFDPASAGAQLAASGWLPGQSGIRTKNGRPLSFTLTASDTSESRLVASQLQRQWRAVGADVKLLFLGANDFQNALTYHNYDAVLNGVSIGVDPDVFVYWDSSQADIRSANRLNLSEYKDAVADSALEAGRTRLDPSLRVIKYKPFLQAWQRDLPALGLYQPRLQYLTNGAVSGLDDQPISTASDRLAGVYDWQIREAKVTD